jgi:hypothetical protein
MNMSEKIIVNQPIFVFQLKDHVVIEVINYFLKHVPNIIKNIPVNLEPTVLTYQVDISRYLVHFILRLQFNNTKQFENLELNVVGFPSNIKVSNGKTSSEEMVLFLGQIKKIELELKEQICITQQNINKKS